MSWSIKAIGSLAAVRARVSNETGLPQNVKTVILDTLDELLVNPPSFYTNEVPGVRVEGYGHRNTGDGSSYSEIGKLEIVALGLTPEPARPVQIVDSGNGLSVSTDTTHKG